jgi:hypothetical protein
MTATSIPQGIPRQYMAAEDIWLSLLSNRKTGKTAVRKLCLKLQKRTTPNIAQGLLARILECSDPETEILLAADEEASLKTIMRDFDEANHTGMVIVNDKIYPLTLDFSPKTFTTHRMVELQGEYFWIPDQVRVEEGDADDPQWCVENEESLVNECARAAMNFLGVHTLRCTVVLSRKFGFTNRPHKIVIMRQQHTRLKKAG